MSYPVGRETDKHTEADRKRLDEGNEWIQRKNFCKKSNDIIKLTLDLLYGNRRHVLSDFIEGRVTGRKKYLRRRMSWLDNVKRGPGCSLLQKRIRAADRQEQ